MKYLKLFKESHNIGDKFIAKANYLDILKKGEEYEICKIEDPSGDLDRYEMELRRSKNLPTYPIKQDDLRYILKNKDGKKVNSDFGLKDQEIDIFLSKI